MVDSCQTLSFVQKQRFGNNIAENSFVGTYGFKELNRWYFNLWRYSDHIVRPEEFVVNPEATDASVKRHHIMPGVTTIRHYVIGVKQSDKVSILGWAA